MPAEFAKKLARKLEEEGAHQMTVDVPNHGFSDLVAYELVKLGLLVHRPTLDPQKLTITQPGRAKKDG